ncbi:MAG: J domain-containing protein [Tissierellia bacterium]|nr:J domain-containing protein [Tissierellia bacterium]
MEILICFGIIIVMIALFAMIFLQLGAICLVISIGLLLLIVGDFIGLPIFLLFTYGQNTGLYSYLNSPDTKGIVVFLMLALIIILGAVLVLGIHYIIYRISKKLWILTEIGVGFLNVYLAVRFLLDLGITFCAWGDDKRVKKFEFINGFDEFSKATVVTIIIALIIFLFRFIMIIHPEILEDEKRTEFSYDQDDFKNSQENFNNEHNEFKNRKFYTEEEYWNQNEQNKQHDSNYKGDDNHFDFNNEEMNLVKACEILGVKNALDKNEIEKAYRSLIKKVHPDLNNGNEYMTEISQTVINAYEYLKRLHS